jgi:capsular exopolysaccharide synthesis family protein
VTEKTIVLPPHPGSNGHDANYRLTLMVPKRRYFSYLRERWWVVLLCLAAALVSTLAYETLRPGNYSSFAQIYLTDNMQLGVGDLFSEESLTYFGTQIELLKSAPIQGAAFDKAGIKLLPGQKDPYKIDIIQPQKASILQLQATGPDPVLTQRFLQMLIDGYLAYKKETRISTSQDVLDSLQDELANKAAELQAQQDKWTDFQKSNNVAVLEEESRSSGLYLSELNVQLDHSRLDQKLLSQEIDSQTVDDDDDFTNDWPTNAVASSTNLPATALIPTLSLLPTTNLVDSANDTALNSSRVQLAELLGNREDNLRHMGEHGFDEEVKRLQKTVSILENENRTQKLAELADMKKRADATEAALPSLKAEVLDDNDRLAQSQRLKENVDREQGYYDHLLSMLQNVDLGKNVQQERLSVLQPATTAQPEPRSLPLRVALSSVLGLFLGLALVFGWYLLDDRFVSFRDITDQFGETLMGLIPQIKVSARKPRQALLADVDSRRPYLESYRHLRSALLLSAFAERRPQILLFTSTASAEGKTTITINLARLLARSGLRIVLVDADARGGGMQRLLGEPDQAGVLDYLRGDAEAGAVMHPSDCEGLSFVPAGTHNEQSEGLFLRPKLADLLSDLRKNHDFVIIDGPPILASDDAAMLVPHADTVVLVTRPFYSRSRLVRQALDMLYQRQARQVNIILNRARADDLAGHYAMNGFANSGRAGKSKIGV